MLEKSVWIQRVHDDAMLSNLAQLGVFSLLGRRLAFIRISPASVKNPQLETFSRTNVVIMIAPGKLITADLSEMRDHLKRYGEMGIKYGWTRLTGRTLKSVNFCTKLIPSRLKLRPLMALN